MSYCATVEYMLAKASIGPRGKQECGGQDIDPPV